MDKLANSPGDARELASAREKIREQKYEIEELKVALSGSHVERLTAELSASYATNRELGRQLEEESEKTEKHNAQRENEQEENEKLRAELKYEKRENEKLIAEMKIASLENAKLVDDNRSQREKADQLAQILEAITLWVEKGVSPLRSQALFDRDDDFQDEPTEDRAA
jgi:hypothetical protein